MARQISALVLLVAGSLVLSIGCQPDQNSARKKSGDTKMAGKGDGTLYARLGREPAIRKVVDEFVARGASDPAVNFTRKGIDGVEEWKPSDEEMMLLKERLVQFIANAAGGPQQYEGRDMETVHEGMKITNQEFNALAGHLRAVLEANRVGQREITELMAAVESTRQDIVENEPRRPRAPRNASKPRRRLTGPAALGPPALLRSRVRRLSSRTYNPLCSA